MKLILALGLIVIQATTISCRSVSKSLAKSENSNSNANIADLILPFLKDQDGNDHDILEVVPYEKGNKKNNWKDLKKVAAITSIGKKENKKAPLAIILTASKMKGLKRQPDKDIDLSFIVNTSDESSEENITKHKRNDNNKSNKQVDLELLTDIDSVMIDNNNEVVQAGDAENIKDISLSESALLVAPNKDKDDESIGSNSEALELNDNDGGNEKDSELNSSMNSDDISLDSNGNDDSSTIYFVEAGNNRKHSHDRDRNEIELHLPEPLDNIDELATYTLKRKHNLHHQEKLEEVSKEKSIEVETSFKSNNDSIASPEEVKNLTDQSEQIIDKKNEEVINIPDEVGLNADSEVISSVNSKESGADDDVSENFDSDNDDDAKSNGLNDLDESESASNNSDVDDDDSDDTQTSNDAIFGSDDSLYSQEFSNELNDVPLQNYNNYETVNNVIEELNKEIKGIEQSKLINELKEVNCDNNHNKSKEKESRKLYNLSFVFNKK